MRRVTVELSEEEADQLEEYSRKEGVSRLEALRRLGITAQRGDAWVRIERNTAR